MSNIIEYLLISITLQETDPDEKEKLKQARDALLMTAAGNIDGTQYLTISSLTYITQMRNLVAPQHPLLM